ncbi:extracellular protein [Amylolactobacillus amylotrophicus DSM 20534]|uniref:Uncharacterized protein n=3 Tax=Amylolactobacillus TaxID=2767876 RepID=A0A1L6XBQ6_9LACO|nr:MULTISPECIES: DUF1002 domain-containing protein [Amylolactobacillus]APT18415.1 hypothetical protein LA20533_03645 [Amylolactobacillus amylophilus DSM 20533 = JCM 1125]KRK38200.1 extracellular protein [Amylolactobacillus amylotrophicus DSM 20534]KRM43158.1 extracellular protein [Amylolactobacillus amylophilus DSM 20533 = JCM 1125]GED80443.1 hypothetical protein LAM01_09160 [Amylolactobacillus amylophilus]
MKKIITFFTSILTVFGIFFAFNSSINTVVAADDDPMVTLGTSLTSSQRDGTITKLTNPLNGANYNTITITGTELVKYLNPSGSNFNTNSGVWSSAMIQKTNNGSGINVKILPYNGKNNITTITANQYKNAALTAGIADANIYVTSAVPIDGSGALAGVYAAYAKNGEALNQQQVNAAQDEMNTLSDINEQNSGKDGYSDAQLNNAVAGAKAEMAKIGDNVSNSQIADIINNQITINNLGDVINNNQKQQIINILINVRDSGALKNSNFKEQAQKLGTQIKASAQNIFNKLNTAENRNFIQKIWDAIVNFFQNLVQTISNWF